MLTRAGLGDDPRLAHPQREQNLADTIVDFVRAGMVEFVALEVDFGTAEMFRQPLGKIERARTTDKMREQIVKLRTKRRIDLSRLIFALKLKHQWHQRFGDIAPAEFAEMAVLIGAGAKRIGLVHNDAALSNAAILSTSFTPGALSTPDETSISVAPVVAAACVILAASIPPARIHGSG